MRIITAIVLLFIALELSAQQKDSIPFVVQVHGFSNQLHTSSLATHVSDLHSASDINGIRRDSFHVPLTAFVDSLNNDPVHHVFWLKFNLKNISDSSLLLHIYFGVLDYIDLYFISDGNLVQTVQGGSLRRTAEKGSFIERNNSTLPLNIAPHQSGEVLVKIIQKTQEYGFSGVDIYNDETLYASFANDMKTIAILFCSNSCSRVFYFASFFICCSNGSSSGVRNIYITRCIYF